MLSIADRERYARYRSLLAAQSNFGRIHHELILPGLLFGCIGAIAWAIRGTNGWGAIDGTIVPGMMWGILWYYVCWRKGIACHGVPLWLGLGIAIGGELGYGQYVSWIQGKFNVGNDVIHVARGAGWLWFFLCGIGWAGPGAIILGWSLSDRASWMVWLGRLTVPAGFGWLGWRLVQWHPELFFPNYGLGIYSGEIGHHLQRTVYTNTQNFTVVTWWAGAMLIAAIQRDKTTVAMGAIVGVGFGFGFMTTAAWCLGYEYAPGYIDWWKMWELNAGFFLGVLYVVALFWCLRRLNATHGATEGPIDCEQAAPAAKLWNIRVAFETLAVFLMVLTIFLESETAVSLAIGLVYVFFTGWLMVKSGRGLAIGAAKELRGQISFAFAVFLFLFVTLHGATSTIGLILELYPPESVDQYAWPRERVLLFLPIALAITGGTIYYVLRTLSAPDRTPTALNTSDYSGRVANLMTGLAAIGAISIWPSKIGALYAVLLGLGIAAFNSINRSYDREPGL